MRGRAWELHRARGKATGERFGSAPAGEKVMRRVHVVEATFLAPNARPAAAVTTSVPRDHGNGPGSHSAIVGP
jgi:hypothetical protein